MSSRKQRRGLYHAAKCVEEKSDIYHSHGDSVWTQMTTSYAELGETCVATTAQLGIVVFLCCASATATFRPVMSALVHMGVCPSTDATLAKCRCVVARAEKRYNTTSAGVVDTRHFAKIRVSQGDLRSKIESPCWRTRVMSSRFDIIAKDRNSRTCKACDTRAMKAESVKRPRRTGGVRHAL